MFRHIGKAAVVALAALLLGMQAVAALGGIGGTSVTRSGIDPSLHAQRSLRALEARVGLSSSALVEVSSRIEVLAGDIAAMEAALRDAGAERQAEQRRLVRDTDAARERIVTWVPAESPTLEELSEPLQVVATALHAGDEHRGEMLSEIGDLSARATEIKELRTEADEVAFELGRVREELASDAALATRLGWVGAEDSERLLDQVRRLTARVDSATMELRQHQARVLLLSTDLTEEQDAIRESIRDAGEVEQALVSSLVTAEGTIRTLVASMLGDSPWGPFDEGVLEVCPVDMPNAYTDTWLAPRYAGGFHLHQGTDIIAPEGTPIRAPFPGEAVAVPNTLGGMAVKVYGSLGYVYNAHLSEYGTLGQVETGDIIGYVGATGDASGPHDHFEWHPGGGPAVNPFEMLNAACRPA